MHLDVFHRSKGWLKLVAPLNTNDKDVSPLVFHELRGWLKLVAAKNMPSMDEARDMSHMSNG
jgi:hypothetical protein